MSNEPFSFKKFVGGLNPVDPVGWAKSISLTLRSAILIGLILAGYGYYRGYKNRPVQVDLKDGTVIELVNGDNKTHKLEAKRGKLYFDGQLVRTKDVKGLKPYGVELHPKLIAGVTTSGNAAAGLGLEVAHFQKLNLDLLALYKFLGVGVSYDIQLEKPVVIDNTSIGIGIGRDFETNENAAIMYMGIEF
jgi:hypothetical protein